MSNTPCFSVITTTYNGEKYLKECLDSIINQTLQNIEIICVDDGSTDNSLSIFNEYAEKDNRIKVIYHKNQGLATSRNKALEIITGEYCAFVDSDDIIDPNMLLELYEYAKQNDLDMLSFSGYRFNEKEDYIDTPYWNFNYLPLNWDKTAFTYKDCTKFMHRMAVSSCLTVYRSNFIKENELTFPAGLVYEDNLFWTMAFTKDARFGILNKKFYKARSHVNNITHNIKKNITDWIEINTRLLHYLKTLDLDPYVLKEYKRSRLRILNNHLKQLNEYEIRNIQTQLDIFKRKLTFEDNPQYQQLTLNGFSMNEKELNNLKQWYYEKLGTELNINNPQTFNEKMQWLKIYNAIPLKTQLADKYLVRDWIKAKIGEEYLVPLLGVYNSFEEIDFNKLPNQFVIKCNHGSGYNIVVTDKAKMNLTDIKTKLNRWMKEDFAFRCGYELHYSDIKPKIIIEKYINPAESNREIQVWCFNKQIKFVSVESVKTADDLCRGTFYPNEQPTEFEISPNHYRKLQNIPDKQAFHKALELAEQLQVYVPFVRIDFIEWHGSVKFREMTFTSGSGLSVIEPSNYNKILGDWIKLPKIKYIPKSQEHLFTNKVLKYTSDYNF